MLILIHFILTTIRGHNVLRYKKKKEEEKPTFVSFKVSDHTPTVLGATENATLTTVTHEISEV